MKLNRRNALITGGSQGLGKAIATQFLQEGANVVLCARSAHDLLATQAELAAQFPDRTILAKTCDVADERQVDDLVAYALRELGSIEALVLNAGVYGPMGPTESVSLEQWRRALDINLFGVLLPCRALIPHFKQVGRGKIVVLSGAGLAVFLASADSDGISGKLLSAQWDPWNELQQHRDELAQSDIYCLRRIVPEDRGKKWN